MDEMLEQWLKAMEKKEKSLMGMYDEFVGDCPYCGKEFSSQTKLFDDDMLPFSVGSFVGKEWTLNIQCKEPCFYCQNLIVVKIEKGFVQKFMKIDEEKPQYREESYGALVCIEKKEKENG